MLAGDATGRRPHRRRPRRHRAARRPDRHRPQPRERPAPRRARRRRHARERLRQARRPRGARRPRQPDLGLCRQAAQLGRLGHRRELPAPGRGDRRRLDRGRPSAARTAPRSGSSAATTTARSSSTCGSGPTRRRLEFATDIDWHDRRILLKARFPLAIRADHATFECAHGVIRRATHRNTSWDTARFEVVAHRFADLSEHGYGVALLNDGKYGHHALGNELGLTLLRSPVYPDPFADEGRQSFTYALFPHAGDWLTGGVLAEAEDLNQPLLCRPVTAGGPASWTAAAVTGLTLGLSGFKPAEDGDGLILRAYEPAGARGNADDHAPRRLAPRPGGQRARGRGRTGGHQLPAFGVQELEDREGLSDGACGSQAADQEVRLAPGRARRELRDPRRRVRRPRRPLGLRQEHDPAG